MNSTDLRVWQDDVMEHCFALSKLVNERKSLKNRIESHLSKFFDWDSIEHTRDFNKIILRWSPDHNPTIRADKIGGLNMDWIIKADYDDGASRIVVVEVYPFGFDSEGDFEN